MHLAAECRGEQLEVASPVGRDRHRDPSTLLVDLGSEPGGAVGRRVGALHPHRRPQRGEQARVEQPTKTRRRIAEDMPITHPVEDDPDLAERMKASRVDVTIDVFPEMQHVFQFGAGNLPESDDAIARLGAFARRFIG